MNLVFLILCTIVIIFNISNIINGTTLKYNNGTCFGSCCFKARKITGYSHVLFKYAVDFSVDAVFVAISLKDVKSGEPNEYLFEVTEKNTLQIKSFPVPYNFTYCFMPVEYEKKNDINSKKAFTFYFEYEYDEGKLEIKNDTIKIEEKQQNTTTEKNIQIKQKDNVENVENPQSYWNMLAEVWGNPWLKML